MRAWKVRVFGNGDGVAGYCSKRTRGSVNTPKPI